MTITKFKGNFFSVNIIQLQIFLTTLSYVLFIPTGNLFFLIFIYVFCFSEIKKNFLILSFVLFISIFFIFLDPLTAKNFFLIGTTIVLYSSKFSKYIIDVLKFYSYFVFIFLIYLMTLDPIYGGWSEVLIFKHRAWFELPNGNILNPNPLGLIISVCIFGFYVNKKYILALMPLFFLMLTQSRSAFLFLVVCVVLCGGVNLKKIIISIISLLLSFYLIMLTPFSRRFIEDGSNGRDERLYYYRDDILNNFMHGIPYTKYNQMSSSVGSLDNMYFLSILKYGIWGGVLILVWIFYFLINKKDDYYSIRLSLFVAFFLLGFFEGSVLASASIWIVFAMCFNSFSKKIEKTF